MNETVLNQALETERRKDIFAYMVERFKEYNQSNKSYWQLTKECADRI